MDAKNKTIIIEKKSKKISQKLHNQSLYLINQFCFIIRDIQFYENDIDWTNWLLSLINKNITNAELEEELSNFISQSIHKVINNLKLSLLKQGGEINFVSIANNPFLMCFLDDTDLIHIVNNKNTIINKLHPDDVSQNLLLQTFDLILRKIKYKMIFINYGFVSYFDITENLYNKKSKKLNVKEFFLMEYNTEFNSFFNQNKLKMFDNIQLDNFHFLLFVLYGLEKKLFTKKELSFLEENKVLFAIKNDNRSLGKSFKKKDIDNLFKKNNIKLTKNIKSFYIEKCFYPKNLITIEFTLDYFDNQDDFYRLAEFINLSKAISTFEKVLFIKHFKSTSYNNFINIKQKLIDNSEMLAKINKVSKKKFISNVKEKLIFEDQSFGNPSSGLFGQ